MKNAAFILALFCAAPLLAQNPPTPNPAAPNPPTLEKPQMAEPPPEDKKADAPAPKAKKPVPVAEGKIVEEIVARVNNEIITSS
jgi:hypothetical protein